MDSAECKKCSSELEYWDEGVCGETELWVVSLARVLLLFRLQFKDILMQQTGVV